MSPERRYRLLLLAYPAAYRRDRGPELLDVLLAGGDRRGPLGEVGEAASIVAHGLRRRVGAARAAAASPAPGLAGASLLLVLAVLGTFQLLASVLRATGLTGYPDAWGLFVLWVDPRWPVHVLWVATGTALLLGRSVLALASAWAAALLHCWLLVVTSATTVALWWPGDVGPHWVAPGGAPEAGWALLGLAGAVLVSGRGVLARTLDAVPGRALRVVAATGLVGTVVALAAGAAAYPLLGSGHPALVDAARQPLLPVALTCVAVAALLRPVPGGRTALALLAVLACIPVADRWSEPVAGPGLAVVLFLTGLVVGSRTRRAGPAPVG